MKLTKVMMWIPIIVLASATAGAQVAADLVAAPEIPPGSAFAPHTPAGVAIVGTSIWVGDAAQGFRHYVSVDPNNTDPINMGQLKFDIDPNFSVGGGSCFPFCSVGQVAQDGNARVYIAVYDRAKGQPFAPAGGGVYMLPFLSTFTFGAFEGLNTVAPGLGLDSNPHPFWGAPPVRSWSKYHGTVQDWTLCGINRRLASGPSQRRSGCVEDAGGYLAPVPRLDAS